MLIIKNKFKQNKHFFLLKFKFIFLNFKYLSFYSFNKLDYNNFKFLILKNNLNSLIVKSNDLISLFKNNHFTLFFKNTYILLYFNNFADFVNLKKNLQNACLLILLFSGYFVNNKYYLNISTYYSFYNNNFNIYIYIIYNFIKLYIFTIYLYILKLLVIILKFFKFKATN
jgi:hypothetical protein